MSVQNRVLAAVAAALHVPIDQLSPNLSIGDIPEWDSMGNVLVLQQVEADFGINLPLDRLFELTTIPALVETVTQLLHDKAQP